MGNINYKATKLQKFAPKPVFQFHNLNSENNEKI